MSDFIEMVVGVKTARVAIISPEDADRVLAYRWSFTDNGRGYVTRTDYSAEKQATVYLHRFILGAERGEQVDHINQNTLDNRRSNLRICTQAENAKNRTKQRRNTSGYKGVYWIKSMRKWRAAVISDGKTYYFGHFDDAAEAAKAYDRGAIALHGEFVSLNFPV